MTRIAVIETGAPPAALQPAYGDYPAMMAAMLGHGFETTTFDAQAGQLPDAQGFDGVIVTGSPSGVYDGDAWIGRLLEWLRDARGRTKLIGVCFGHQAMAQAFGGRVEKSERGWGVGLHSYETAAEGLPSPMAIPVSHQDQVVDLPPGARVIVRSDFTPYAGLAYGGDAVSLQGHPEFQPAYAAALVEGRRGSRLTDRQADAAVASLEQPNDRAAVAQWLRTFLNPTRA